MEKKNFKVRTRVKFVNLPGDRLTEKTGCILGTSMVHVTDFYIVMLDEPFEDALAIVITEACLEEIKND